MIRRQPVKHLEDEDTESIPVDTLAVTALEQNLEIISDFSRHGEPKLTYLGSDVIWGAT